MTSHRYQHNFTFSAIKNKPDNEYIRHGFLFCFHQKKSAVDAYRIICETYDENVLVISVQIGLNDLKMVISLTQRTLRTSCNWKMMKCGKMGKNGKRQKIF